MSNYLENDHYQLLGDIDQIGVNLEAISTKIESRNQNYEKLGMWASLGWKDDRKQFLKIKNSKIGNTNWSKRDLTTVQIAEKIDLFIDKEISSKNEIVERYINFEEVDFGIDWRTINRYDDIPELRLELFVDQKEGAMVYYFHQDVNKVISYDDENVPTDFILCEATKDHDTKRDRLTYFFKVIPPFEFEVGVKGELINLQKPRDTAFIIKIMTFKRMEGNPKKMLDTWFSKETVTLFKESKGHGITYNLFGEKKNALLIYDDSVLQSSVAENDKNRLLIRGTFYKVDEEHSFDPSKKTLLLIHGTWSNTFNTFGDMIRFRSEDNSSELQQLKELLGYEQILAFDHPTISANCDMNIEKLKQFLGADLFSYDVDIISASRGCILAQAIGGDDTMPFKVGKCIMFSPANGVGYFDVAKKYVSKGLNILSKVFEGSPAQYIFALLQFSADYFIAEPGCKQMTFNSVELNKVLDLSMINSNSQYFAVINDWKPYLSKGIHPFGKWTLDKGIRLCLGSRHDWVVGYEGQHNLPKKYNIQKLYMDSTHCKYFTPGELWYNSNKVAYVSTFINRYFNEASK